MDSKGIGYDELLEIVKLVEASPEISFFRLKYGSADLEIRKGDDGSIAAAGSPPASQAPEKTNAPSGEVSRRAAPAPARPALPEGGHLIKSPMVGLFYRAPEPGATPFVEVGQRVSADTTVCIIEVMKLMNSLKAGRAGVVRQILARDADPVEFGQPLIVIDPE